MSVSIYGIAPGGVRKDRLPVSGSRKKMVALLKIIEGELK